MKNMKNLKINGVDFYGEITVDVMSKLSNEIIESGEIKQIVLFLLDYCHVSEEKLCENVDLLYRSNDAFGAVINNFRYNVDHDIVDLKDDESLLGYKFQTLNIDMLYEKIYIPNNFEDNVKNDSVDIKPNKKIEKKYNKKHSKKRKFKYKSILFKKNNRSLDINDIKVEFSEFKFVYDFDDAIILSKSEQDNFGDSKEEIDELEFISEKIKKGTRIGITDARYGKVIETVIVIKNKSKFYSPDGKVANDMITFFKLQKNTHYAPTQEQVDLLDNGYKNLGGDLLKNATELKQDVEKYQLDYLLLGIQ